MGCSGYIDWHRLDHTMGWVRNRTGQHTYVYAFYLVDYGSSRLDRGVSLLKDHRHPDWFVHAETADNVLAAYAPPKSYVSPNFTEVFDNKLNAMPLLAAVLLGTSDTVYRNVSAGDRLWWAAPADLTRRGRRLLKDLNRLYERDAVLVTFLDAASDEDSGPRDPS